MIQIIKKYLKECQDLIEEIKDLENKTKYILDEYEKIENNKLLKKINLRLIIEKLNSNKKEIL